MPTIKVFHAPLGVAAPGGAFLYSFIAVNLDNVIITHELGYIKLIKENDILQIENFLIFFNIQSVNSTLTSVKSNFAELNYKSDLIYFTHFQKYLFYGLSFFFRWCDVL